MSEEKFRQVKDGERVHPQRKGYRMKCCDCGLVHRMDFKLIKRGSGRAIIFRAFRENGDD